MSPLARYYNPIVCQYYKLQELVHFVGFNGAQYLLGEGNGSRVQPITCYKFKMDWIIQRLMQFASCIFLAQDRIIVDGLVDDETVDDCMDLFRAAFEAFDEAIGAIKDIDCNCDQTEIPEEEAKRLKMQEICQKEVRVRKMVKQCREATKTLVDELKIFLPRMVNERVVYMGH